MVNNTYNIDLKWDAFWICVPFGSLFVLEMGRAFLFIPVSGRFFPFIGFRVPFGGFAEVEMGRVLDLRPKRNLQTTQKGTQIMSASLFQTLPISKCSLNLT